MGLRAKMCEQVYALVNEVKAIRLPLIVEVLKLDTVLKESLVSNPELIVGNTSLVDELAEVSIVWFRWHFVEKPRSQDIDVDEKLPSFVATQDLLLRIVRHLIK